MSEFSEGAPIGINYHTDSSEELQYHLFKPERNRNLDQEKLRFELQLIKDQLHCNSIKIQGNSSTEAVRVAQMAQQVGLNPWLSPRFTNHTFEETKKLFQQYCEYAKQNGLESKPLIVANELLMDMADDPTSGSLNRDYASRTQQIGNRLMKGESFDNTERVQLLVQIARDSGWKGTLIYCQFEGEKIDWAKIKDPNIAIGINLYWGQDRKTGRVWTTDEYDREVKKRVQEAQGRPVVITEFGTVPQKDAITKGGAAHKNEGVLDEEAQAQIYDQYLRVLRENRVGYFAYTFHEPKEEAAVYLENYGATEEQYQQAKAEHMSKLQAREVEEKDIHNFDDQTNKSYGIVEIDPITKQAVRLKKAAQVFARHNELAAKEARNYLGNPLKILEDSYQ